MHAIFALMIGGFILINLIQGTLGLLLFQIAVALLIPIGIRQLGAFGQRHEKRAACHQLEADIRLLKRCRRNIVDPELCQKVGADEATIRKTIRQATILTAMLESYQGGRDHHLEQLFGGQPPSLSQCAAVIVELRYLREQLGDWLSDRARRDIMITTGQFMRPGQVGGEIRKRGAAISAIRREGSMWITLDRVVAPIAGIVTFISLGPGLFGAATYAGIRILATLYPDEARYRRPALEPTSHERTAYAEQSTHHQTDINRLLLDHTARSTAAGRRTNNNSGTSHLRCAA